MPQRGGLRPSAFARAPHEHRARVPLRLPLRRAAVNHRPTPLTAKTSPPASPSPSPSPVHAALDHSHRRRPTPLRELLVKLVAADPRFDREATLMLGRHSPS